MAETILSIDIGSSSLKAALIDFDGRLLAFSRAAYPFDSQGAGKESCGASVWEKAFALALEELYTLAPGRIIDGVCISGNGPTLVPVDREGEALPPLYWYGPVATPPEGEGQNRTTANKARSFFLPHAAWFMKNSPGEYEKTSLFISSHEWLASRLGAEPLTVLPQAAYEPYYWDDAQCHLFGLDKAKFPPFVNMGSLMGKVSAKAASLFGPASGNCLKSGSPIIAGGPDFITALIGTGTMRPGYVCDRAGSSEGINFCAVSPPEGDGLAGDGGLRALPHAKEGLWNIGAVIPSSGRLFEWYRKNARYQDRPYEELLAELIPLGNDTEIYKGAFLNPSDVVGSGLYPASQAERIALGRAVLCAIGFAVRSAAETLAARGFPVEVLRVSGGQAKNPRWNQLKADITGLSLMIPGISDGELAGNAALSAAALDEVSIFAGADFEWALEGSSARMIRFQETYTPRSETRSFWDERYRLYKMEQNKR